MLKRIAILGWVLVAAFPALSSESFKIKTPRGAEVEGLLDFPASGAKAPVVILAPGQGYHMGLPILAGLAQGLVEKGVAAVRFNWHYFSADPQNGEPSADLKTEIEDMNAVLELIKKDARVDTSRILLAGKSLGTMVAYPIFRDDPSLKALLLLTPVCTWSWDDHDQPLPAPVAVGAKNYPGFAAESRPVVITLGNADPLCSLPMLYDFLKDTRGNVATVVVGGNHSWNVGPDSDPTFARKNSANIAQAVATLTQWVNLILEK